MSTVPSGVLPFTASGPSAMFPVHPARYRTHALTIATRVTIDCIGSLIVECLLRAGHGRPDAICQALESRSLARLLRRRYIHSTRVEILQVGAAMRIAHLLG